MSRCIHVYPFVARNHGGIPFSGVCPLKYINTCAHAYAPGDIVRKYVCMYVCPLHTNSGCGKERRILIGPW